MGTGFLIILCTGPAKKPVSNFRVFVLVPMLCVGTYGGRSSVHAAG